MTLFVLTVVVCVAIGSLCEAYDCTGLRGKVKEIVRSYDKKTTDIYVFVKKKDLEDARRCIDITRILYQVNIRYWTLQ